MEQEIKRLKTVYGEKGFNMKRKWRAILYDCDGNEMELLDGNDIKTLFKACMSNVRFWTLKKGLYAVLFNINNDTTYYFVKTQHLRIRIFSI